MIALFVALGGASYAAIKIPKNSVGAAQIKKNAVTSAKVKDRSLLAKDFKAGQIPAGARGPQGLKGDQGDPGTPATALFAAVGQDGSWLPDRSSDVSGVTKHGVGDYEVIMLADLTKCTAVVSASSIGHHAYFATANILDLNSVEVRVHDAAGILVNDDFSLAVFCK
jgi:hypothetical protein